MELNGEDKRIRALFCELKREDERKSPLFAQTWKMAEAEFHRRDSSRLRFQLSSNLLRFATAILVVSLVLAATVLLPKYLRLRRQPVNNDAKQETVVVPSVNSEDTPWSVEVPHNGQTSKPVDRLVATRKSVRVKKSRVAFARREPSIKRDRLSEWQSPTAKLLRSAGDELLRFTPQMNESAEKMKKFLTNDLN